MNQSVEIIIWLALAWIALVWANLHLWRTRRLLRQLNKDLGLPARRLASTVVAEPARVVVAP